ncbi:MAG: sodium:alanine symporter family protein [Firmicutes bacterium]|nr:sodium:alanine symporter family protein [Candidatus Colimorpha enterica]
MDKFLEILKAIDNAVWGVPTLVILLGTGLFYTIRLKGIQFTKFPRALKMIFEKEEGASGDVSPFASLCTSLAATIGTGSIVGVATALRLGGPGALFWMWVSALLGMATKYAECLLAVRYREQDDKGNFSGGPMYYIEKGMGKKWKPLAVIFAVFALITTLLGTGVLCQSNSITEIVNDIWQIPTWITGLILTVIVALVILGGIKSISKIAEIVVPVMAILYVGSAILVIGINFTELPSVFGQIFKGAFSSTAIAGGVSGTLVISMLTALRSGVARGVFSNEAGLGSSPIASASAQTNSSVRQGLISMTGVFFTTIVICTMTGIVVISSGLLNTSTVDGSILVGNAFGTIFTKIMGEAVGSYVGKIVVAVGIIFFSFTTIIGWSYYGERCLVYLTGSANSTVFYRIATIVMLAIAPFLGLEAIWTIADITNALMALPNLIGLLFLSKDVIKDTKEFFDIERSLAANKKQ